MKIRMIATMFLMLAAASPAMSQVKKPNAHTAAKPPRAPANTPAASPASQSDDQPGPDGWPKIVQKELHAADFRGKKAPELKVEELFKGKTDHKDKVLLIDLWATWCGPCKALIPELNQYQEKFKDDLVVVGISDEKPGTLKNFLNKTTMNYAVGTDTQGRMKKELKVNGIPHVIIVSTDGIVRWQGFPGEAAEPLTEKIVAQIIKNDPGVQARHKAGGSKDPGQKSQTPNDAQKSRSSEPKPAPKSGGG